MNKSLLVLSILILSFIKQNRLIKWLTSIFNKRLAFHHHIKFSVGHSRFEKVNQIEICNVCIDIKGFHFAANSILVDFNLIKICSRSRFCSSIVIDSANVILSTNAKGNQTVDHSQASVTKPFLRRIICLLQKKLPCLPCENVEITKVIISSNRYGTAEINKFRLSDGTIKTSLILDSNLFKGNLFFECVLINNEKYITISDCLINCSGISLMSNTFSIEKMTVFLVKQITNRINIAINVSCKNLFIKNENIYPIGMLHKSLGLTLDIDIVDDKKIIFNKSSILDLCGLKFALELNADIISGLTTFQVLCQNIIFEKVLDLLSRPSYLTRVKTEGSFNFRITCNFNASNWKNSSMDAKLLLCNFKIINFADLELDSLKYPFIHTVYNSYPIRLIELSKANDSFLQIEKIPKHLIDFVIRHEDPDFFRHKGVSPSFMGYAFMTNFYDRRITRGGSTITMQLIRNLFLGHSKNLQRKMEEIVLALMLENFSDISKQRIMEIYLNIIEFGPDIYGLSSACRFYFGKHVSEITIIDSIILTYIIPRPKYFLPALLKKTPQLKSNLRKHIDICNIFMQEKGFKLEELSANKPLVIQFSKEIGPLFLQ